jgi:hypothetical protein
MRSRRGDELDVDSMSYEQLLALGERMGEVKSKGLTKAEIKLLPTSKFVLRKKRMAASAAAATAAAAKKATSLAPPASSNSNAARRGSKRRSDDEQSDGSVSPGDSRKKKQRGKGAATTASSSRTAATAASTAHPSSSRANARAGAAEQLVDAVELSDDDGIVDLRDMVAAPSSSSSGPAVAPVPSAARSLPSAHRPAFNPHKPQLISAAASRPVPASGALFAAPSSDPFSSSSSSSHRRRFSSDFDDADADAESSEASVPQFVAPDMRMHSRREGEGEDDAEMAPLAERLFGARGFGSSGAPLTPPKSGHTAAAAARSPGRRHIDRLFGSGAQQQQQLHKESPGAAAAIAAVAAAERTVGDGSEGQRSSILPTAPAAEADEEEEEEEECCIVSRTFVLRVCALFLTRLCLTASTACLIAFAFSVSLSVLVQCLTAFEEGDSVKRLQCSHLFHAKELDKWLFTNKLWSVALLCSPPLCFHASRTVQATLLTFTPLSVCVRVCVTCVQSRLSSTGNVGLQSAAPRALLFGRRARVPSCLSAPASLACFSACEFMDARLASYHCPSFQSHCPQLFDLSPSIPHQAEDGIAAHGLGGIKCVESCPAVNMRNRKQ